MFSKSRPLITSSVYCSDGKLCKGFSSSVNFGALPQLFRTIRKLFNYLLMKLVYKNLLQTWAAQFRLSKNERFSYVTHLREVQLVNLDSSDLLFSKMQRASKRPCAENLLKTHVPRVNVVQRLLLRLEVVMLKAKRLNSSLKLLQSLLEIVKIRLLLI